MTVNQFFKKALKDAITSCKIHKWELRSLVILEFCSTSALFKFEYVNQKGEYNSQDLHVWVD